MRFVRTTLARGALWLLYARFLRESILSWYFRLPTLVARLGMLPMEPASLLMERKMLRGIRQRAENLARERVAAA